MRRNNLYLFTVLMVFTSLIPVSIVQAAEIRHIDIASVSWPGAEITKTQIPSIENAIVEEVGPRWKRYTSLEYASEDQSIDFRLGRALNETILYKQPISCEGAKAEFFMKDIRSEVYRRFGIDNFESRYLIILIPNSKCVWSGRALMGRYDKPGGVIVLQDNSSPFIIAHELGHSLGLGHSNLLRCSSGKSDGPWGTDCKAVEYAGVIDVMGNVEIDSTLSIYNQWKLGLLKNEDIRQSWLSEKVELSASDLAKGTRAIFLKDGKSTYWIEYRRSKIGENYKPGLVIFRSDPPPISSVVSPNPEDATSPEFGMGVTSDIWMLNWDNYNYLKSRVSGSMTLPEGETATLYSGNISIKALSGPTLETVSVLIDRKIDASAPAKPILTDSRTWNSPDSPIIQENYDDPESAIKTYEISMNGEIFAIKGSPIANDTITYLYPFGPKLSLHLRDLPEGRYSLSVRGIDEWGNIGPWSSTEEVSVDRAPPLINNSFEIASMDKKTTHVRWTGAHDQGVGLCSTLISNDDGFVLSRSNLKSNPILKLKTNITQEVNAYVYDCLGNGKNGRLQLSTSFIEPKRSKRTGKWETAPSHYGPEAIRCRGRCSISFSVRGKYQVITGFGSIDVSIRGKDSVKVFTQKPLGDTSELGFSPVINVGEKYGILRISGTDFIFGGLARVALELKTFTNTELDRGIEDLTLSDVSQRKLSQLGWTSEDFAPGWKVLPMYQGTTLLDPTLDLCGSIFQSEKLRNARRQVVATNSHSPYQFLSSEVVEYESAKSALEAENELRSNLSICMRNNGGLERGVFTPYTFRDTQDLVTTSESPVRTIIVDATVGSGKSIRELLAFYQFKETFFSGIYVVKAGSNSISGAERARWAEVANYISEKLVRS